MRKYLLVTATFLLALPALAQDDLMKMLEDETKKEKHTDLTTATFKTTRLINGHSIENVAAGVLDFKIQHRLGFVNTGIKEFFGLDQATIRLGLDYGISDRLMVGLGRSSYQKQLDAFYKFKILRQSSGSRNMPITLSAASSIILRTDPWADASRKNYFTSRLYYSHQLIIARKFSESFSLQLMPTMVHHNLVPGANDPNNLYAMGVGGRIKLSKRVSFNGEYYYQLPGYRFENTKNSVALGFDIETGGHVFQLHFTNSTGMTEKTYINETSGDFFKGDIHFGFNISRVFTIKDPRKKKAGK